MLFNLLEQRPFRLQVLGDGLHDEVGGLDPLCQFGSYTDLRQRRRGFTLAVKAGFFESIYA